jgi:hypothetical protein
MMDKTSGNSDFDFPADRFPASNANGNRAGLFPYSERHLKCAWFAPEFRPVELRAESGETVIVEKPGRWNLEKGPDFLDAALLVGAEHRRITGDIEVHIHPADWQNHGHSSDPAYARVIAHITFFPDRLGPGVLPPTTLQIALKDALLGNPLFSFESIDITAYPFALRKARTPCSQIISRWEPETISKLLHAAGKYRLETKSERLANAAARKGEDQVLYEEIMSALGYKHNRLPFRQLAERVSVETLREDSSLDPVAAYALLAGVAGLLPAVTRTSWDNETRRFVRKLWNSWWKFQAKWSSRIMPAELWSLSSVRPQNHPRRRLMAAAVLFTGNKTLTETIAALEISSANVNEWLEQVLAVLQKSDDNYWSRRFTIGQKPSPTSAALIGARRAAAIISNVIIPLQIGRQHPKPPADDLLKCLPAEEDNAVIRQCAFNLIGPDHTPAIYRDGLSQQGLIQIFHDFCLADRSNCAECGLIKMIENIDGKN